LITKNSLDTPQNTGGTYSSQKVAESIKQSFGQQHPLLQFRTTCTDLNAPLESVGAI